MKHRRRCGHGYRYRCKQPGSGRMTRRISKKATLNKKKEKRKLKDLDFLFMLPPSLREGGTCGFKTNRVGGDDNGDIGMYDTPSSDKVCIFEAPTQMRTWIYKLPGSGRRTRRISKKFLPYSSSSAPAIARVNLDLDLLSSVGDPKESGSGSAPDLEDVTTRNCFPFFIQARELVSPQSNLSTEGTFSGLVLQDSSIDVHGLRFLQLDHAGGATVCAPFGIGRDCVLIDSCNGLLLCMIPHLDELRVHDPMSEVTAVVPQALTSISEGNVYHGLAFDGRWYHVVSLFILPYGKMNLKIFSSEPGARPLESKSVIIPRCAYFMSVLATNVSTFFFEGILFFLLCDWIFVYRVKDGHNRFIKLPHSARVSVFPRCMWQSEGRLYYGTGCHGGGFKIWVLSTEEGNCCDFEVGATTLSWKFVELSLAFGLGNGRTLTFLVQLLTVLISLSFILDLVPSTLIFRSCIFSCLEQSWFTISELEHIYKGIHLFRLQRSQGLLQDILVPFSSKAEQLIQRSFAVFDVV